MSNTQTIEKRYKKVVKTVHDATHRFMEKKCITHLDYDEWHGEACLGFVQAYLNYDAVPSNFATWVWTKVWWVLAEKLRREAPEWYARKPKRRQKRQGYLTSNDFEDPIAQSAHSPLDLSLLSMDGQSVVQIVLSCFGCADGKKADAGEIRVSVYKLLSDMGWSFMRVVLAFNEIKMFLQKENRHAA